MGMYDSIRCKTPLPGKPPDYVKPDHVFQTKSLDCELAEYEITEDGRLVRTGDGWLDDQKEAERLADEQKWLLDFTGAITFDAHHNPSGRLWAWVGYTAVFVDGKLVAIRETSRRELEPLPMYDPPPHIKALRAKEPPKS